MVAVLAAIESMDDASRAHAGVHPSAVVHETARLAPSVSVGANAVIEARVEVGADSVIGPGAVLRRRTVIGSRVIVHPNAVIGADGFGYVPHPERGLVKVPHVGRVVVEDDAEIGAGTCVDRAKFGETRIGGHVKIDNLVQIGHGCTVGAFSVICGQTGLAGSVRVGKGVTLAASVGIADNRSVGDGARLGARAGVMHDVPAGSDWIGAPAMPARDFMKLVALQRAMLKERSGAGRKGGAES